MTKLTAILIQGLHMQLVPVSCTAVPLDWETIQTTWAVCKYMLPSAQDFGSHVVRYLTGDHSNMDFIDLGTKVRKVPSICNDEE